MAIKKKTEGNWKIKQNQIQIKHTLLYMYMGVEEED